MGAGNPEKRVILGYFRESPLWSQSSCSGFYFRGFVNGFRKAGLLSLVQGEADETEPTSASSACARNNDSDSAGSDVEAADSEGLNEAMLQLFVSDTEGSNFEGFEGFEDDDETDHEPDDWLQYGTEVRKFDWKFRQCVVMLMLI